MRFVAVGAAVPDGCMLPKEGASFFRMAIVAEIIGRVCPEKFLARCPVGIVAVGALRISRPPRIHVRITEGLSSPNQMALRTSFVLRGFRKGESIRDSFHQRVATRARDITCVVSTRMPIALLSLAVAVKALGILGFCRFGLTPEGDGNPLSAPSAGRHVGS